MGEPERGSIAPSARFDSLDGAGRSFVFEDPCGEVVAASLADVRPALRRVEEAVSSGVHATGLVTYEAAGALDPALSTHPPRPGLPLVWFALYRRRTPVRPLEGLDESTEAPEIGPWSPSITPMDHARRVAAIRELIAAGDTYQVNLTFRLAATTRGGDEALYQEICRAQRAGYCALLRGGFGSVLSASPELFFRWTGDLLEMRPMKGTRPRGRWAAEDDALAAELLSSPKEIAENLMIVDLLRNDAGRLAEFGSVEVPDLFRLERYPTVHQLTSTVAARTRPGTTLSDVLSAIFPSGSVTGAPKVRAMQIIRELEAEPRGVYTGAIGYVSPDEAVFNVPIRTLLMESGGTIEMGVGSGITYDSDPAAELAECMQKAAFVHERAREMELLETLRLDPGVGFHLLDRHLSRIERSAAYFAYPFDRERVLHALESAAAAGAAGPLRVRLLIGADGTLRVSCAPLEPLPSPLTAAIAAEPVDSRDRYLYHKTTARETYERRRAARPDLDEALLVNEAGELTEFTTGNLEVVIGRVSYTPPVSAGLLPGVAREAMLEAGSLVERRLRPADLARAEAVYLINSVRDRIPVRVEP